MGKNIVLCLDIGIDLLRRQDECIGANVARDNVAAVLGIEAANLLDRDLQHIGYLLEVHPASHLHRIGQEGPTCKHGTNIVVVVIVHHIVDGNEGRHVSPRLARQVRINLPIVGLAARATDSLAHIAGAAVVRGYSQCPVVIDAVEVFEVAGRHGRRLDGIAALVDQAVHLESHALAGLHHELPQAGGTRTRSGIGSQCRLDDGQIFQFEREPFTLESLLEDRHVVGTQTQQVLHQGTTSLHIHVDIATHHAVVGHLDNRGQLRQLADIDRVGIIDIHAVFQARIVDHGILLYVPVGQQCIQIGLHTLGIHFGTVRDQYLHRVGQGHLGRIQLDILLVELHPLGEATQRKPQTC